MSFFSAPFCVGRQSESVKSSLVSSEACVLPLYETLAADRRLGKKKPRANTCSQTTLPPGQINLGEYLIFYNLGLVFQERSYESNCCLPPPLFFKPLFKSLQGFSFIAGTLFIVVSHCCREAEGWLPEAGYKVFNEFLLQGITWVKTHKYKCFHPHVFTTIRARGLTVFLMSISSCRDVDWIILSCSIHLGVELKCLLVKWKVSTCAHMELLAGTWELPYMVNFRTLSCPWWSLDLRSSHALMDVSLQQQSQKCRI